MKTILLPAVSYEHNALKTADFATGCIHTLELSRSGATSSVMINLSDSRSLAIGAGAMILNHVPLTCALQYLQASVCVFLGMNIASAPWWSLLQAGNTTCLNSEAILVRCLQ